MKFERARITVRGAVQGVGFRPFVYRLATELALRGWVLNSSEGVYIEVEGARAVLNKFLGRLEHEKPPRAFIHGMETSFLDAVGYKEFEIRFSEEKGAKTTIILPDIATCPDCLREIFDPADRRYLYQFTNCTNCGPRFSIIESLPYDRANTSMKKFLMCQECEGEYHDPANRRFHAQPNACPSCGPQLQLWDKTGRTIAQRLDALLSAAQAIREGRIVALKGIGGFQLLLDARNDSAVRRLRDRKHREEKPFALMFPSLDSVQAHCEMDELEARLLQSPEAAIVLLERKQSSNQASAGEEIATSVAPLNPWLGAMLPYSPLHHVLMRELKFPVVATSGNAGGEPICIDECEAVSRLSGIADIFLVHNRPIVRQLDDSIVRAVLGRTQILRRARGYAPLPVSTVPISSAETPSVLAVGAHFKNSVAFNVGDQIFLGQHVGDLETERACQAFQKATIDFQNLYEVNPSVIACDLHPEYVSTKYAEKWASLSAEADCPVVQRVQHHYAHVLACAADNEIEPPLLGLAWDGTGLGTDGTIWGGEFLLVDENSFSRVAHIREFRLTGGEAAIKQPRRVALGLLWEIFGDELFGKQIDLIAQYFSNLELSMIHKMLSQRINSPLTTSMGRLFDGLASILDLRQRMSFEGQAAMELEFAAREVSTNAHYQFELTRNGNSTKVDWQPVILEILEDIRKGLSRSIIACKFHNALAESALGIARLAGVERVVLTGGCFQNKYLTERTVTRLQAEGFRVSWHQRVPPNDGGVAFGQVVAALRQCRTNFSDRQDDQGRPGRVALSTCEAAS